jgi:hypothetical protein
MSLSRPGTVRQDRGAEKAAELLAATKDGDFLDASDNSRVVLLDDMTEGSAACRRWATPGATAAPPALAIRTPEQAMGLLIGPLAVALFLAMLRMYKRDYSADPRDRSAMEQQDVGSTRHLEGTSAAE